MNESATHPIDLTDQSFAVEVLESDVPVLVDFHADWCQPCRVVGPVIDALADELAGRVKVAKVDVDTNRALSERYAISSIPTILVFDKGEVVQKFVGVVSREQIIEVLET